MIYISYYKKFTTLISLPAALTRFLGIRKLSIKAPNSIDLLIAKMQLGDVGSG